MTKHHEIIEAENNIEDLRASYLRRWGWEYTCNVPGSYWMWRRDFADVDAQRKSWDDEHGAGKPGGPSASRPYGVITAPTELAVSMTTRCLDEQPELGEPDD